MKKIKIDFSEKRVMLYRVEKIFAIDGSSSEELLEPGHDHMAKEMGGAGGIYGEEQSHGQHTGWVENNDDFNNNNG